MGQAALESFINTVIRVNASHRTWPNQSENKAVKKKKKIKIPKPAEVAALSSFLWALGPGWFLWLQFFGALDLWKSGSQPFVTVSLSTVLLG